MSSITASLGPLKAIKGGRTPGQPDARTPAHPDAWKDEQPDARPSGQPQAQTAAQSKGRTPAHPDARTAGRTAVREGLPLQDTGKRSHPDFRKRTVLLRDTTWKAAARKWEDEGDGDFSNLVEKLLQEYGRQA